MSSHSLVCLECLLLLVNLYVVISWLSLTLLLANNYYIYPRYWVAHHNCNSVDWAIKLQINQHNPKYSDRQASTNSVELDQMP